jgi:hypothetical protein
MGAGDTPFDYVVDVTRVGLRWVGSDAELGVGKCFCGLVARVKRAGRGAGPKASASWS